MSTTRLAGLRPVPLASYLATLGLARVLAVQADSELRLWWDGETALLDSSVDDLPAWLADSYRPTPILSPWNEGSGFGRKDKASREALVSLVERGEARLEGFRRAHAVAAEIGVRARDESWVKERTVRELRNRCPDDLLDWIDASVVLAGDSAVFPPLLGTGGNDGRLDFSTTFHQRLLDVLPVNRVSRLDSLDWATDALFGTKQLPLKRASVGQFDPFAAGGTNTSAFGAGDSFVNPWTFVLLVEGSLLFASGVSRRLGTARRAAVPFYVRTAAGDFGAGAAAEASRGETWAPLWQEPMSWAEISQLFREARASWRGRPVTGAVQMYEATRSLGITRGVDRFVRFGLHQRNGLAYVAVPLDTVEVIERQEVRLAAPIEDWLDRVRGAATSASIASAYRATELAHLSFARQGGGSRLVDLLAAVVRLELALGRSRSATEKLKTSHPAWRAGEYLAAAYHAESIPEVRVAASVAAAAMPDPASRTRSRDLREVLLPLEPTRSGGATWGRPQVPGLEARPLVEVLADAVVWRAQHWSTAEGSRGLVPFLRSGVTAPAADIHAWVAGELDEDQIERHVLAFLTLSWGGERPPWGDDTASRSDDVIPDPLLAMLHALASGALQIGDGVRIGIDLDWPLRLRVGQEAPVAAEVVALLRRCGWRAATPMPGSRSRGAVLLAGLVPRPRHPLRVLLRIAERPRAEHNEVAPAVDEEEVST